jgi:hypothetical protein
MSSTECPVCKTISSRVYKSVNVGDIVNDTIIEASNYMMYGEKLENPNFKKIL